MKIEEAKLYLEHTSIDDFKLEEHQKQNRYEAIQVVLEEIESLNNIINEFEDILKTDIKACDNQFENTFDRNYRKMILEEKLDELQELKDGDK